MMMLERNNDAIAGVNPGMARYGTTLEALETSLEPLRRGNGTTVDTHLHVQRLRQLLESYG
jgi:hypothetical protein